MTGNWLRRLTYLIVAFVWQAACADSIVELTAVSSRPGAVSGGDILVELRGTARDKWLAQLNGRDVTSSFRHAGDDRDLALLNGLRDGKNTLTIGVNGTTRAELDIRNHPLSGPIFSGPHQQPFVCQTIDNGLGAP